MQPRLELTHLDLNMPDIHGFVPDPDLIGDILTHTARGNQYVVTGFAYLGGTDEWGYEHRLIGDHGPTITRPLSHLCGERHDGEHRYVEWRDYRRFVLQPAL